jgi:hypothetical protein
MMSVLAVSTCHAASNGPYIDQIAEMTKEERKELFQARQKIEKAEENYQKVVAKIASAHKIEAPPFESKGKVNFSSWNETSGKYILLWTTTYIEEAPRTITPDKMKEAK